MEYKFLPLEKLGNIASTPTPIITQVIYDHRRQTKNYLDKK